MSLAGGWRFHCGGKAEIQYTFYQRDYAERLTRTRDGLALPGASDLEWDDHRLELSLDYYFDQAKAWRSKSLMRLRRVVDSGHGHDDFWMFLLRQRFVYERPTWEVSAQASFSHYDYDVQTVRTGADTGDRRHRSRLSLSSELTKKFGGEISASLAYSWEFHRSNDAEDRYDVSVFSVSLGRTF